MSLSSHRILSRNVPEGATAALFFVSGDLQFVHVNEKTAVTKIVSVAACQDAFGVGGIDSGWLPEGVVRSGSGRRGRWTVGFNPPRERNILIETGKGSVSKLTLQVPPMIFMGIDTQYFAWAIRQKSFSPQADCYRAPFPNLSDGGRVCFGANAHPQADGAGFLQAWDLFWQAPFTSHQIQKKSKAAPKDVRKQLRDVARSKKAYPVSDLVSMKISVERLVTQMLEGEEIE